MNYYSIMRIPPVDGVDTNSYVCERVHGNSPADALDRCVRGKGRCSKGVRDTYCDAGPVYQDLFLPDDGSWYVVSNDDFLHDFDLLRLDHSNKRRKFPKVVKVRT